jgi:hypothetical protein
MRNDQRINGASCRMSGQGCREIEKHEFLTLEMSQNFTILFSIFRFFYRSIAIVHKRVVFGYWADIYTHPA